MKVCYIGVDGKSKMAAIAEHNLILDPMGKTYELMLLETYFNKWMYIMKECSRDGPLQRVLFGADPKSKMADTKEHS